MDPNTGHPSPGGVGTGRLQLQSGPPVRGLRPFGAGLVVFLLLLAGILRPAAAQYFGRNKVQYNKLDFRALKTPHFDIYYYPATAEAARDAARMAERWNSRLSRAFNHQLTRRKPIILYANQSDFQQTNVIEDLLGEGTGGVTEPYKDRVILPFTGIYAENDHVLGHELVHVFQFDLAHTFGDSLGFKLDAIPLWAIEGMAEYLTLGRDHPLTAMWLRDAVLHNDFPTIAKLSTDPRYFPYRYGQALWAYIGGRWGDAQVDSIFRRAGRFGLNLAIKAQLGIKTDSLSTVWRKDVTDAYGPAIAARTPPEKVGRRLLGNDSGPQDLNLAPAVSPDGRHLAFLSQRGIFSIDLYLADARTGKIEAKLVSSATNPHFEAMRFIDSSGSWSPDGKRFAFVVYADGTNKIAIVDVKSHDVKRWIRVPGVGSITNPAWSPDGEYLAFSGTAGGISDLYLLDVRNETTRRLTNDRFAELQPAWSPDGRTIAFVTDRDGTDFAELRYGRLGIGLMNVDSGEIRLLSLFANADEINPEYSPDGRSLYFISNRDGFPDIYRTALDGGGITQITRVATGISGITGVSPAMSVAHDDGRLLFSVFERGGYGIYELQPDSVLAAAAGAPGVGGTSAAASPAEAGAPAGSTAPAAGGLSFGRLPPLQAVAGDSVDAWRGDFATGLPSADSFKVAGYSPRLSLDYIGTAVSGLVVDRFGTALGGAVALGFSDILGNRVLQGAIQANGSFKDLGAEASYLNRARRWNWGLAAGHIPYLSLITTVDTTTFQGRPADAIDQYRERVFVDQALVLAAYPFSMTRRFEVNAGYTHYGFSLERERQIVVDGILVTDSVENLTDQPGISLFQGGVALVGDYSYFGFTSPSKGGRYRFAVDPTLGSLHYVTLLADYRKYVFLKPVTLAARALHYGRYGSDSEDSRLSPLFVGYPTFVRGYDSRSFDVSECSLDGGQCPVFDRLVGSRLAVASLELRVPVLGTREFGLVDFPYLPTELSAFLDGGAAWTREESLVFKLASRSNERTPVFSAGLSARVNVLGALVLEFYYVYPFQRPDKGAHFGIQFAPGW